MLIEYQWSRNILPRGRTYRHNVCVQLESIKTIPAGRKQTNPSFAAEEVETYVEARLGFS